MKTKENIKKACFWAGVVIVSVGVGYIIYKVLDDSESVDDGAPDYTRHITSDVTQKPLLRKVLSDAVKKKLSDDSDLAGCTTVSERHEDGNTIVDVRMHYESPYFADDTCSQLEDTMAEVASEVGGYVSTTGPCVSINIPDNEVNDNFRVK